MNDPQSVQEESVSPTPAQPESADLPAQEASPAPAEGTPRPRRSHTSKKRASVYTYLLILFVAAFFLMGLSYFMQQRTIAESLDGLKDSVSAMEKAQLLQEENLTLKEQVEQLEEQLAQAQQVQQQLEQAQAQLEQTARTAEAMDWFWQIDEAYVRGRYALARSLIEQMDPALTGFLPQESVTDTDRFSPAQRYQEIYDALY